MKKIASYIISFILIVTVICFNYTIGKAEAALSTDTDASVCENFPSINSSSCILMDATTGQIIYEKNARSPQFPASITKIMTAYLATEKGDLSSTITMSHDAVWGIDRNSSHIALDVGEQISMSDALYAVMLLSANEAAWAIAEQVSGSLDAFVQLMNETAAQLGCEATHFSNANGLPDPNHYTSAYDMALITRAALQNETFCTYAEETYHEIPPTNKNSETRYLTQNNQMMLANSEFYYPYCQGGKTGYTEDAGGTLVTWADKDGMKLICVTMGAENNTKNYEDSIAMFEYVYSHFSYVSPLENFELDAEDATRAQTFLNSYYNCENYGTLHLEVDTTQPIIFPEDGKTEDLEPHFEPSADRLEEGYIGTLSVTYQGSTILTLPVSYSGYVNSTDEAAVQEAYENGTIRPSLKKEKKSYTGVIIAIVVVVLIVIILALRIHYVKQQRELQRQKRARAMRRKQMEEKKQFEEFTKRHRR